MTWMTSRAVTRSEREPGNPPVQGTHLPPRRRARAPGWLGRRLARCGGALLLGSTGQAAALVTQNGGFDSGAVGWSLSGGAEIVATAEPGDNPFARVPDGGAVFLYQEVVLSAPAFTVAFDFFTGLMASGFPSPGGFPDTAFASVYAAASDGGLAPEQYLSDGAIALLEYDALNGLRGIPVSAMVKSSDLRPGWARYEGTFAALPGQPVLALTFQNLDGNGVPGDAAWLVDNVSLMAIPEPPSGWVAAIFSLPAAWCSFRWGRRHTPLTP